MACEDLVAQCFSDEQVLAVPELNLERTLRYLECCYQHGMSWEDAKQQIQTCLQGRGVPHQGIISSCSSPSHFSSLGWTDLEPTKTASSAARAKSD